MLTNDPDIIAMVKRLEWDRRTVIHPRPVLTSHQPPLQEPYDFMSPPRPRAEHRRPRSSRMYSMQDQAPDARQYTVFDKVTGQALGRVRGTAVWARGQILLLLKSLKARPDEVYVR